MAGSDTRPSSSWAIALTIRFRTLAIHGIDGNPSPARRLDRDVMDTAVLGADQDRPVLEYREVNAIAGLDPGGVAYGSRNRGLTSARHRRDGGVANCQRLLHGRNVRAHGQPGPPEAGGHGRF